MFAEGLFEDRTVLVTGGGRGIGAEIAIAMADLGADVAVNDLYADRAQETAAAIERRGQKSVALPGDVSDPSVVTAIVEEAASNLGVIQHAVNNAGSNNDDALADLDATEWNKVMGVNLDAAFFVSRTVADRLQEANVEGSIVNISSIAGLDPQPGAGAYSASKAAIIRLTEQMALEWAEDGIRVNGIAPGLIWTPATDPVYSDEELFEARRQWVPMEMVGDPEDVARTAVYLLAPENRYTTGETAVVDGGASKVGLNLIPGRAQHE